MFVGFYDCWDCKRSWYQTVGFARAGDKNGPFVFLSKAMMSKYFGKKHFHIFRGVA